MGFTSAKLLQVDAGVIGVGEIFAIRRNARASDPIF
jgi:hypothetical protein